jgi:hypothetical protein
MKQHRATIILLGFLSAHLPIIIFVNKGKTTQAPQETNPGKTVNPNQRTTQAHYTHKEPVSLPHQTEGLSHQGTQEEGVFLTQLRNNFPYMDSLRNQNFATGLRRFLKANDGARDSVASILLDPATPIGKFANLALVLGSMDDAYYDRILLEALLMHRDDSARAQWAIFALGTWRENPDWNQRFGFDERGPMILRTEDGISTPVYHQIEDWAVLKALTPFMLHQDGEVRTAAILSLRHSLNSADVRESFVGRLQEESDPGIQATIAEALARNIKNLGEEEKSATVDALIDQATNTRMEGVRMKILHPLQSAALSPPQIQKLENMAFEDPSSSVRRFALSLLSSQGNRGQGSRQILLKAANIDPDPNIRSAVIQLIQQQSAAIEPESLVPILANDTAWNVRHSALRALSEFPPDPESASIAINAVKNAALNDPDPKVSEFAMSILHGGGGK